MHMNTCSKVPHAVLHVLHLLLHSPSGVGEGSIALEAVKVWIINEVAGDTAGSVPANDVIIAKNGREAV